jgi:ABC-type arginine transport system permease subunit
MSGGHLLCADRSETKTQNHITKYNTIYKGYGELIEMLSIFFRRTDKIRIIYAKERLS